MGKFWARELSWDREKAGTDKLKKSWTSITEGKHSEDEEGTDYENEEQTEEEDMLERAEKQIRELIELEKHIRKAERTLKELQATGK